MIGHTSPILCASFSPTGSLLATGSGDTNARLWDLDTETPSHVLSGHKGWVLCVEWEAMERKLATGGHDGHVRADMCDCRFCNSHKVCYRCDYGIQRLANPSERP
jgi:WD40 repeat protein